MFKHRKRTGSKAAMSYNEKGNNMLKAALNLNRITSLLEQVKPKL